MKTSKLLFFFLAVIAFTSFTSCSSDDDDEKAKLSFKDITLKAGTTHIIENGDDIQWTSDNEYIASVKNRIISAHRVGTTIISGGEHEFNVTVEPTLILYNDPCLNWGASISKVKSFMSGYELMGSDSEALLYKGQLYADYIGYIFNNGKLSTTSVYVPSNYSEEVSDFLAEKYIYAVYDEDEGYIGFVSVDFSMVIFATISELGGEYYWNIIYMEATADMTRGEASADYSSVIKNVAKKHIKGTANPKLTKEMLEKAAQRIAITE